MTTLASRIAHATKKNWRLGAVGVAIATLAPALYAAPAEEFKIGDGIFKSTLGECEAMQSDADAGAGAPSESRLNAGICMYQLMRTGQDREGLLKTIGALEDAQSVGLGRSRQATANLLEGLAACRIAQIELQPDLPADRSQSVLFCLARKSAQASFAGVKLQDVRVSYPQSTGVTADALVDGVGTCYGAATGPLNTKWSAGCGTFATSPDNVAAAVNEVHTKIYNEYLNGASAPLTAMFMRKKTVAESGLANAVASKAALVADSARIGGDYQEENGAYQSLANDLTTLVQSYQSALVTSTAVLKSYDSWKGGLFLQKSPTVVDYGPVLDTRITALTNLAKDFADPQAGAIFVSSDAVAALTENAAAEAKVKSDARALCRVYYCELAVNDTDFGNSSFADVCNFQKSPLCPQWNTKFDNDAGTGAYTTADFCRAADFPSEFLRTGMSWDDSDRCWAGAQ